MATATDDRFHSPGPQDPHCHQLGYFIDSFIPFFLVMSESSHIQSVAGARICDIGIESLPTRYSSCPSHAKFKAIIRVSNKRGGGGGGSGIVQECAFFFLWMCEKLSFVWKKIIIEKNLCWNFNVTLSTNIGESFLLFLLLL